MTTTAPTIARRPAPTTRLPLFALVLSAAVGLFALVGIGTTAAVTLSVRAESKQLRADLDTARAETAEAKAGVTALAKSQAETNEALLKLIKDNWEETVKVIKAKDAKDELFQKRTMETFEMLVDRLNKLKR